MLHLLGKLFRKRTPTEAAVCRDCGWPRTVLAGLADGLIVTDAGGGVSYLNAAAQSLTGWRQEEAAGQPLAAVFNCVHEQPCECVSFPTEQTIREGVVVALGCGVVLVAKDGTRKAIEGNTAPLWDGKGVITGAVLTFRDVTERRAAERVVREGEERFRCLVESAPVMLWLADADGQFCFFNKTWLEFTGRATDQEAGDGWTEGVHADDLEDCLDTYTTSFDARQGFDMEFRLRGADGEYRWVLTAAVPRFTPGGEFAGYAGATHVVKGRVPSGDTACPAVKNPSGGRGGERPQGQGR